MRSFLRTLVPVCLALALPLAAPPLRASNCAGTSTGMIPVNDLGAGFYKGVQGGLYPGGVNVRPAAHEAAGVAIANAVVALDTLGQPDAATGHVVFVSIGMSNCTQEFSAFVPKSNADPVRRGDVRTIDCAVGGQTAQILAQPTSAYWDSVATRLRGHGSAPRQVQIVWLKDANANPTGTFEVTTDTLAAQFFRIVQIIKAKLPNVRQVFFTSRIYAGYASSTLNPEPYAYENAFAIKRVIAQQLAGDPALNYDAANGPVVAPWLSWGPYLWADGLNPRSDGLTWACSELNSSDGTHPSATGRLKVADSLLAFVRRDAATAPWYTIPGTLGAPRPGTASPRISLSVAPNPSRGGAEIALSVPAGVRWRLVLMDPSGRRVDETNGVGTGSQQQPATTFSMGIGARPGSYFVVLEADGQRAVQRHVVLGTTRNR